MSDKVRPYGEFEFCKAVHCSRLARSSTHADQWQCLAQGNHLCIKTFKQFNRWVNDNSFMILKPVEEDDE